MILNMNGSDSGGVPTDSGSIIKMKVGSTGVTEGQLLSMNYNLGLSASPTQVSATTYSGCFIKIVEVLPNTIFAIRSGSNGGAILMCQTLLNSNRRMDFCECYWHELGHFYAITTQEPGLDHYSDPWVVDDSKNFIITDEGPILGLSDERIIQQGYWFWQEFVAQAIANTVMHKLRPIKQMIWHPDNWYWISDALNEFLTDGLYANYFNIDEYSLAQYFATYLLDDCARGYVQAALDGKLLAHNMDGDIVPTSVEPTGFSGVPEGFQEPLWRMKSLVEKQLQNEQFWLISKDALFGFGNCIADMMLVKFKLITSGKL